MRVEKKQMVNDIGSLLGASSFLYFVSYKGLKVKEFNELRTDLHKLGTKCYVIKNRLIRKAAEQKEVAPLVKMSLSGDTAVVAGSGDAGEVAKSLAAFSKKYAVVAVKGGFYEGAALSKSDVEAIASLPPKPILRAQFLGVLQAPSRNLVNVLYAKLSGVVNVLSAYKDKKEKQ